MDELWAPDKLALLIVEAAGGRLSGKTLLQKRAYFLSKMLGIDLDYGPHYYGPYSSSMEDGLARLKALGFIEERTLGFGVADQVGFEVRRYDYALTEDGTRIVESLRKRYPDAYKKVHDCLGRLAEAGDTGDYLSLSIAAKTYHILASRGASMTNEEILSTASQLGWNIARDSLDRAVSFLEKMELVKTA